jgi:hypothetical protein
VRGDYAHAARQSRFVTRFVVLVDDEGERFRGFLFGARHGDQLTRKRVIQLIDETRGELAEALAVEHAGDWLDDSNSHPCVKKGHDI